MSTWDFSDTKHHMLICNGGSCMRCGGDELTLALREEITRRGLDNQIHTTRTRCNGRCQDACVTIVYPEGIWYRNLEPEDAKLFVHNLMMGEPHHKKVSHYYRKIDLKGHQECLKE
jgi:(2Fe-2S) ferredoxin